MCCPKSPKWESEGGAWSEDESVSSSGSREGNVMHGSGDVFLKDWELAKVALGCYMALDRLCQKMNEAW